MQGDQNMAKGHPWEDKWIVIEELGKGGQGMTLKVVSRSDPSLFAVLKKLHNNKDPQQRRRMHREVSSLEILAPAGAKVPRVLDGNTREHENLATQLYFVMELIPGRTLEEVVVSSRKLPLEKSTAVVLDLCRTTAIAHSFDVIHRDLKPDNIVVRDFDKDDLAVVDFGLSFNAQEEGQSITQQGENFRNRFILLPETNALGGDRRDKRSDITALCGIFYFCLTGHYPGPLLDAKNLAPHSRESYSVRHALSQDPRVDHVETLLDCGFAMDSDNRFQAIDEFVARLKLVQVPVTAQRPTDIRERAARRAAVLFQRDRRTQLLSYAPHVQRLSSNLLESIHRFDNQLGPFVVIAANGSLDKLPLGLDKVGDLPILSVTVRGHQETVTVFFVVGSRGSQCVLLRMILMQGEGRRQTVVDDVRELLWYAPDRPPEVQQLNNLIDEAVDIAMERLQDEVLRKRD
jgi:serine/threonine protein kinase